MIVNMDEFKHVQNETDILNTLEHLSNEEKTIVKDLDTVLANESELEQLVTSLVKHISNISLIENDAESLSNLMNFTSSLGENVSRKIKLFDLVKNRVGDCLKQVEDIIDLRSCTEGIQKALMNENYEEAARHIYRFLSMDESMLRKSATEETNGNVDLPDSCSLEQSFVKLHEAEQKLKSIVINRFDQAVSDKNMSSVERFFKIFPLIKQHQIGLDKFSNFLCTQINEKIASHKTNAATRSGAYLEKISHLFESIAQIIDIQYPLIETYYGPGNLLNVIIIVQKECDKQSRLIINDFKNEKKINTLISTISKLLKNSTSQNINRIDPKEIDKDLIDMMYIINRSQTYLNFISNRLLSDVEFSSKNSNSNQKNQQLEMENSKINGLIRDCTLTQLIHDLNSIYVLLEEYFLKESVQKAIFLDSIDAELKTVDSAINSSMLDDVFFIIKKCLKRSISCGSINVILAMINNCVAVLETCFYDVNYERIKCGYSNTLSTLDLSNAYNALQSGRYLQSSVEAEKMKLNFITSLNNLDVSCEYINRLSDTITKDVTKSGILQKNQVDLFESCLSDFRSITGKFKSLTTTGMHNLFTAVLKPTVKSMIDSFTSTSHILSDEDVIAFESTDGLRPFIHAFLVNLSAQIKIFNKQLTEKNFDILLAVLSGEISNRFYKGLFKCNFNKFGGFQFDREVRAIISYLSSTSTASLRDHFVKLKFICTIFTLENIDEINDYINSEGNYTALRINPNELHQLLKLYTELKPMDIRKIKI